MGKENEQVIDFLEKMEIEAQGLVNRGVRYYAKPATEVLAFAKLALEVVQYLADMLDIWVRTPCDYEAVTYFAEKLKSHYPHTQSIRSTINKELAAFRETIEPAIALDKAKDRLIQWLVNESGADICSKCSKKKEWEALWEKNHFADCPYLEKRECAKYMVEYFSKFQPEANNESEPEEDYDPEPDAHTCDYSAEGECKICGAIRYGSMLYREIYGGE